MFKEQERGTGSVHLKPDSKVSFGFFVIKRFYFILNFINVSEFKRRKKHNVNVYETNFNIPGNRKGKLLK